MFPIACSRWSVSVPLLVTLHLVLTAVMISTAAAQHQLVFDKGVRDAVTQAPIPVRVYVSAQDGTPYFFSSDRPGACVVYKKQNWINANSVENHTTITEYPCSVSVPPGVYTLRIESGKSYLPMERQLNVSVDTRSLELDCSMVRWNSPRQRGWYSGDTHLHRSIAELRNVALAEDLNVVLPLTNWVTDAERPPSAGDKNESGIPRDLVKLDEFHVIWPRNTEYEIFRVGGQRHTLGALFVLGHRNPIEQKVPPWGRVIDQFASDETVAFDMDKLDWPFAMLLPTIAPNALYELSNNHVWRTEFAFRDWNTHAPSFIHPPFGSQQGGHRAWIDYTLGMYYALLNCGLRLPPSAGTASGVHPVPAGFSRVYVHLPDGFSFESWMKGLNAGRSFVTTGPMLYANLEEEDPGHVFKTQNARAFRLHCEVRSEKPLSYGEVLVNGKPTILLRPKNRQLSVGPAVESATVYESVLESSVSVPKSGWVAVRFWEPRDDGQSRFVHSAPWYLEVNHQPVVIGQEEKSYLVQRMRNEIQRSRGVISEPAIQECLRGLRFYESLPVASDLQTIETQSRSLRSNDRDRWLDNMIIDHRFNEFEIRNATGLPLEEARREINTRATTPPEPGLRLRPYPGGRHPRRGFLDGALNPQRETKVSVFPPWEDGGYVVVDVPEAIFSNLGLTYLAHTHIPTIWEDVNLEKLEWTVDDRNSMDSLTMARELPNGIRFTSQVSSVHDGATMSISLYNGTDQELSGLRVQVCAMLKGAVGFQNQEKLQTLHRPPFIAIKAVDKPRWIITGWSPNHRCWTNPPVPCVHSDPVFPDCSKGETVRVSGGVWFYEGENVQSELARLNTQFFEK